MTARPSLNEAIDAVRTKLLAIRALGWRGFDCSEGSIQRVDGWSRPVRSVSESLADIRGDLGDCTRCKLAKGRTHLVFGAGHPEARLMFVGEGPGFDEDRQGEPFVGAAGQLLTKIIQAIDLTRDRVYIANIVKCRPPNNRNPMPDEIDTCLPFLKRQIAAIQPEFICTLGTVATQSLLGTTAAISRLRGRYQDYDGGIRIMPTYHPAYLLRNPKHKRDVWQDMQLLMKSMSIP